MDQRSLEGWGPITVPHDFNAAERVTNRSSVGWYRRDIRLARHDAATRWIVRFEGAGHFFTVYLNGRILARHAGDYLPFEAELKGLRRGLNRLVVRVSSMRARTDLSARGRPERERPASLPSTARYRTFFGVRDLRKTPDGRVLLNGCPLRLRGASLHEDDPVLGAAWRAPQRAELLRRLAQLGANVVRAHYPLHPAVLEALDRRGVLVWDQAPV